MHGLEDVSKWSMQAAVSRTWLIVLLCRPLELGSITTDALDAPYKKIKGNCRGFFVVYVFYGWKMQGM